MGEIEIDNVEFEAEFRFRKEDIPTLAEVLAIPDSLVCPQGTKADGTEGLCCALKRFAYPCRCSDMIPLFGRTVPELSMISNVVVDYICNQHSHKLLQWNEMLFHPENLQAYANAIHFQGATLNNCIGFVDGTVRPISRPRKLQRSMYNGHKRIHALKFQSVVMIGNLYGLVGKIFYH